MAELCLIAYAYSLQVMQRTDGIDDASHNDNNIVSVSVAKVTLQLLEDENSALSKLSQYSTLNILLKEGN